MRDFIDYSQYHTFSSCPLKWVERYLLGMAPRYLGQRDDALALGSLVHAGIEAFNLRGTPEIPSSTKEEMNPSPECLHLATSMVEGWARTYAPDPWELERQVEEPLRAGGITLWMDILAKLDRIFRVKEPLVLESGVAGYQLYLEPGVYVEDYKTSGMDRGSNIRRWTVDMQADFQCIVGEAVYGEPISGVLINVLEKPRAYTPKRKCKGSCGLVWEFASYIPSPSGKYICPMCGEEQELSPLKETKPPVYSSYRILANRSPERLEMAKENITTMVDQMAELQIRVAANPTIPWDTARWTTCNGTWGPCEYFEPHAGLVGAAEMPHRFEKKDPFRYVQIG